MMPEDFTKLVRYSNIKPNPSGQNFHYKIIDELRKHHRFIAISLRPITSKSFHKFYIPYEVNNYFYYPSFINRRLLKKHSFVKNALKIVSNLKYKNEQVVIVDLLNTTLVTLAKKMKHKYNSKIVGILTDNPHNLSITSKRYIEEVEKGFDICDAFITLTPELEKYVNKSNRPSLIEMGILDEDKDYPQVDEDKYIFFAGALFDRYGVQILVDGFKKANVDAKLVTAGQGPLSSYLATLADNDPRFVFLDVLPHEQIKQYEQHALININPRIFTDELDKYSVPSKVIEYASSGRPTISTIHTGLKNTFNDSIYWLDKIDKNTLAKAINDVLANIDNATEKAKLAKEIAYQNFNSVKVVEDINKFLNGYFKK